MFEIGQNDYGEFEEIVQRTTFKIQGINIARLCSTFNKGHPSKASPSLGEPCCEHLERGMEKLRGSETLGVVLPASLFLFLMVRTCILANSDCKER